jgi:hypothetical protein
VAEQTDPTDQPEAPANQVSVSRWAELKRAYVARRPKEERDAAAAATAEWDAERSDS